MRCALDQTTAETRTPLPYRKPARSGVRVRTLLSLSCALIVFGTFGYIDRSRPLPQPLAETGPLLTQRPTTAPVAVVTPKPPPGEPVEKVYQEKIVPLLADFERRNQTAADRAVQLIHDRMSVHRAGIQPFAKDLTRFGTRMGVVKRYTSDAWRKLFHKGRNADQVKEFVNDKFRVRVMSEHKLHDDVASALRQFDDDMAASRNRLYADLSLPLSSVKIASPAMDLGFDRFRETVQQRAGDMTSGMGRDTMVGGIAELAGAWVATDVAQGIATRVVSQVVTQLGTTMAIEGAEAGGATLGGAGAGGGAGSLAGPAGTVVGIGVGLAIGAVVDYWLSARFEARLTDQCNRFISTVDSRLVDGTPKSPGLKHAMQDTVKLINTTQRQAILATLNAQTAAGTPAMVHAGN